MVNTMVNYPGRKLTRIFGQCVNQMEAFLFKHNAHTNVQYKKYNYLLKYEMCDLYM